MPVEQAPQRSGKRPAKVTSLTIEAELKALARERAGAHLPGGKQGDERPWLVRQLIALRDASLARGHGLAWLALGLLCGVVAYFSLPHEPHLWALLALAGLLAGLSWHGRAGGWLHVALMALALVSGIALAAAQARFADAPQLLEESVQQIEGTVVRIEQRSAGRARLTLERLVLEDQAPSATPRRARVTVVARAGDINPSARVQMLAQLGPPPEPVMPGARNTRRELYFRGIGATGFSYGRPVVLDGPSQTGWMAKARAGLATMRLALASRFAATLPDDQGVLAATLLVGVRDGLSEESHEALRSAGLAHLLAISGMHMAMMTLSALALFHLLAAAHPSASAAKATVRMAALGGLVIATGYLLLSGASIATQRAFIMIAIALVAMLIARRALTVRAVALAAIVVVLLHPESLLGPSFQMSFAATLALVAFYAGFNRSKPIWTLRLSLKQGSLGALMRPVSVLGGIALTSLVAGLATAPFAAYHFSYGTPLALLGNVLALPLVSLIIMPAGLLALLLTPFALEAAPLMVMGFGIEHVMRIAHWVAQMEGARIPIASITPVALFLLALGGCLAALFVGRGRLLGLAPCALIPLAGFFQPVPMLIVEREAATVAYINRLHGEAFLDRSSPAGSRFAASLWHQRLALEDTAHDHPSAWGCDQLGCILTMPDGRTIAHAQSFSALMEDCDVADVIITALQVPQSCAANLIIDGETLRKHGAVALLRDGDDVRLWPSFARRTRPWEANTP